MMILTSCLTLTLTQSDAAIRENSRLEIKTEPATLATG